MNFGNRRPNREQNLAALRVISQKRPCQESSGSCERLHHSWAKRACENIRGAHCCSAEVLFAVRWQVWPSPSLVRRHSSFYCPRLLTVSPLRNLLKKYFVINYNIDQLYLTARHYGVLSTCICASWKSSSNNQSKRWVLMAKMAIAWYTKHPVNYFAASALNNQSENITLQFIPLSCCFAALATCIVRTKAMAAELISPKNWPWCSNTNQT